jgi:hypothetical protein
MYFKDFWKNDSPFPESHTVVKTGLQCTANQKPVHEFVVASSATCFQGLPLLLIILIGITLIICPVHANQFQIHPLNVTELFQNSVFILRDFPNPVTSDEIGDLSGKIMKTCSATRTCLDTQFFIGNSDIAGDTRIIAYAITVDDYGRVNQFIGRAHSPEEVSLIHGQANAWKNNSLDRFVETSLPLAGPISNFTVYRTFQPRDNAFELMKSTHVIAQLPYGEVVGQYSLKKIISGSRWDSFGLQTDISTIPGSQISGKDGYYNAETRVTHLWEGQYQKYIRDYADPLGSQTGVQVSGGLYHSSVANATYSYTSYQSNVIETPDFSDSDASPSWLFNATLSSPYNRSEFSPVSIVSVKKPSAGSGNSTLMTIQTSAKFSRPGIHEMAGKIQDTVSVVLVNSQ